MSKQDTGAEIYVPDYTSFTHLPNAFLRDERVSLKARGLMTTMFSFPPNWDYSIRGLASILPDGLSSIRASIQELEKYGYMYRVQTRNEKGQMGKSKYYLIPEPDKMNLPGRYTPLEEKIPSSENQTTVKKPSSENPSTDNPPSENRTQLNIKELNTKEYKAGMSVGQSNTRAIVEHNINYQSLLGQIKFYEHSLLDSIVDIMVDTYEHMREVVKIGNRQYTRTEVKEKLDSLTDADILDILTYIRDYEGRIQNPYNFTLALLLQGKFGQDPYWSSRVKNDMRP